MSSDDTREYNQEQANATGIERVENNFGIGNAEASGTFLMPGAPDLNLKRAEKPLTIHLPNGNAITSMHTCNCDIPWLPTEATQAHIVPGLVHTLLISIK